VRIGPALAGARTKAGMSVEDVSERTRIRRTIISDIERDDYSSCGGDFYARGHIRAIAKAVGTDPAPLIEQYDEDVAARERAAADPAGGAKTRPDPGDWLDADSGAQSLLGEQPPAGRNGGSAGHNGHSGAHFDGRPPRADGRARAAPQSRFHQGWRPSRGAATEPEPEPATQPDIMAAVQREPADPAARRVAATGLAATGLAATRLKSSALRAADWASPVIRDAVRGAGRAGEQSAREAGVWLRGVGTGAYERFTRVRTGEELPSRVIGALAIFLAVLLAVFYGIFSGPAHSAPRPTLSRTHATGHAARTTPPARHLQSRPPGLAPAAVLLHPVRAVAFGPGGISDGDNSQLAGLAISGSPGVGWYTNWYTTADFGGLQAGTGLILDLGRPATVSAVTISLGPAGGAWVQLRAGNAAVPGALRTVAQAQSRGGDLTLSPLKPVQARYVLIWFTRLPPDSSGTYQATIYHVSVTGRSAGA